MNNEYGELKKLIEAEGLLNKQPLYYTYKVIATIGFLALSLTCLVIIDSFWIQLLNAVFLAFVFCQIGFIGHDAGHRAISRSLRINELIGLGASFLISISRSWWIDQHNQHHKTPNDLESDPHTAIPLLAFSREQACKKQGLVRLLVGYQAFYFVPLLFLEGVGIRLASIRFLLKRKSVKYPLVEPISMTIHFTLYFGILFYLFNPWQVLVFTFVHQTLFGLYFGAVFAPNHKGMLIVDKNNPMDFLRMQVVTSRNIKPNRFVDFWYGGLNYQIEHHLFTIMPRNQLGRARRITKDFCQKHGISYREENTFEAWRDILINLHEVSAPLRREAESKK